MFFEDEGQAEPHNREWFGFIGDDSGGYIGSSIFRRQFFFWIDSNIVLIKGEQIMGYILMIISLVATGFIFTVE